jgi:chemotaxis protein CheC
MAKESRSLDIMKEIVNTGLGEAADALSRLVDSRVIIKVPDVHIMDIDQVMPYIKKEVTALGVYIAQDFKGAVSGRTILCYTQKCSISLLNAIYGDKMNVTTINETGISTLNEVGNIIMVSYISAISNFIDDRIHFDLPETTLEISEKYFENLLDELKEFDKAIVVKNLMQVKDADIEGYMFVLLSFRDFHKVVEILSNQLKKSK